MENLEIEVKFYIDAPGPVREKIMRSGAVSNGRFFEENIRYETKNKDLIRARSLLRLRQSDKTTLTFKSPPPALDSGPGNDSDLHYKIHTELEVEVSDFTMMNRILKSAGFHQEQVYEKWRETFSLNNAKVCIDEMPFGNFLEIEGTKEDIANIADRLGFDWQKRIILNYLKMFEIIREKESLAFAGVTFENFKDLQISLDEFLPFFEAGND